MSLEKTDIGTYQDWLKRAKSNLSRSRQPKPDDVIWEDLCFDAQQSVEKALKALLVFKDIAFRFVHDIAALLTALEQHGIDLPESIKRAAELTEYAVTTRYPGTAEPVTAVEHQEAVQIAETVMKWVQTQLPP